MNMPASWSRTTLRQVADIKLGKMLDAAKNKGQPVPYLRNTNVRWGSFNLADLFHMRMTTEELETYAIKDGDILVCEGGEPGRAAVWRSGPTELKFQKALHRARACDGISPEFLAHYLRHICATGEIEGKFTGTTIKHLPLASISDLPLPLAPTSEQQRIVAKIGSLSAKSRRAREQLDHVPRLVEQYKQAILVAALRGELTQDWRSKQVDVESAQTLIERTEEPSQSRGGREATTDVRPGVAGLSVNYPGTEPPAGWAWVSLRRIARQETGSHSEPQASRILGRRNSLDRNTGCRQPSRSGHSSHATNCFGVRIGKFIGAVVGRRNRMPVADGIRRLRDHDGPADGDKPRLCNMDVLARACAKVPHVCAHGGRR
jgi:type I restriction enzyme, S subunit